MGIAKFGAFVYQSRKSIPIRDAEVIISRYENGVRKEMKRLVTGPDGQTPVIELYAPDKNLSMNEDSDLIPYFTYDVKILNPGFVTRTIKNVQLFDTVETMLPIESLPVPQDESVPETGAVVDIPEHTLVEDDEQGCQMEELKPQLDEYESLNTGDEEGADSPSTFILNQVVIPEYIIVHLGRPNDTQAKNVWISFPDYIKNVASSEIYPTWPENSLRANILCQISFALNRIYTEWYPSRGYNFHITNSTQYDQKFIYGRNIFDSVSKIVDEIFNQYVRKPGKMDPFFTEYCDGKQVTCRGLKQWGTVTLANQGYTPKQIIEYYYGKVEIDTAQRINGIPQSYPGVVLRLGSVGEPVKTLQRMLNRIAKNYPNIKTVQIDGNFRQDTQDAVRTFQKTFKLNTDGAVGPATWYKISYIYTAVKKLAELDSEGEEQIVIPGAYPGYIIRQGQRGDNVKAVQYIISLLSTYYHQLEPLKVDGIFGASTTRAVKSFQEIYNLSADGLVGRNTWQKLIDIYVSMRSDINFPNDVYPGNLLRVGSRGEDVQKIQVFLDVISQAYPNIPSLSTDGIFGSGTQRSVRAFQQQFGLTSDGIVGRDTWNSIVDVYYSVLNDEKYSGRSLKRGSTGPEVRKIQTILREISYIIEGVETILADSIFGIETENAVKQFQKINGLITDGIIGKETWNKIVNMFNKYYYQDNYKPVGPSIDEYISNNHNIENEYMPVYSKGIMYDENKAFLRKNKKRNSFNPLDKDLEYIKNLENDNYTKVSQRQIDLNHYERNCCCEKEVKTRKKPKNRYC